MLEDIYYDQLRKIVIIDSVKSESNVELISCPSFVDQIISSMNIAADNGMFDILSDWSDRSVSSDFSTRDSYIMVIALNTKNSFD